MSPVEELLRQLSTDAQRADELHAQSRALLVNAVRTGAAQGLSQREIAAAIGRSQPEVSRLLRFHGTTPRGRILEGKRREVIATLKAQGAINPRVFGSVARGTDDESSDIDLLVDFVHMPGLMSLGHLEHDLGQILGSPVDVVPASGLKPHLRDRVLQEAVPL